MKKSETIKTEKKEVKKPKEYNPRWKGYVCILFASFVSFTSASSVPTDEFPAVGYSISIGAVTFGISMIVLILDRLPCFDAYNYTTAYKGKVEGIVLLFSLLWWIFGISFLTRAGGLAYRTLNTYFSSWVAFAVTAHTLNEWAAEKDIISIQELTALSATLNSWYTLLFSSMVILGSSANLHPKINGVHQDEASFAISLGLCSTLTSLFFILVHYKFFPRIKQGGWLEVSTALVCLIVWTIGVAVITKDNGIASTINGKCASFEVLSTLAEAPSMAPVTVETNAFDRPYINQLIPGSNLYFFTWSCLLASLNIMLRWKAAQALQFAHSQQDQTGKEQEKNGDDDADEQDDDAI